MEATQRDFPVNGKQTGNGVQHKLPFVIGDRTLVNRKVTTVETATSRLPEMRDYLERLEKLQSPEDFEQSLAWVRVSFFGKRMSGQLLNRDGLGSPMLFSANGASQMARMVLPSRFFSGLRELALLDEQGERLATDVWAKFAKLKEKDRMVRTVRMQIEGVAHRVIRSCHSTNYASYSNLEFTTDLIEHSGVYSNLPVLSWNVTDSAMRLRFAGIDSALSVLMHWDAGSLGDSPIPMVECWNSEVGRRKVGLRGGLFKLSTGGSIPHWDPRLEWSWIHRGSAERIQVGVQTAFKDLIEAAEAVVGAYNEAMDVDIDDVFAWLVGELNRGKASKRLIAAAKVGLDHPDITPGSNLAAAVDAVTIAALAEKDIFEQYEVERLASQLLKRGLDQSKKTDGPLVART